MIDSPSPPSSSATPWRALALTLAAATVAYGCASAPSHHPDKHMPSDPVATASAVMAPTSGNATRGTVVFTRYDAGVRVVAELTGLTPGPHGFHIHERGDCSAPDASSAGGHFNPTDLPHGLPSDPHRHVGDFGNIIADENGIARFDAIVGLPMHDGPDGIIGKAVIVHVDPDDGSQPVGNAGARAACGVIEAQGRQGSVQK